MVSLRSTLGHCRGFPPGTQFRRVQLRRGTSVRRGDGRVVEDGVGATDVSHGSKVGQGKAVEILGLVAGGAERKAPVSNRQATAIPVVHRLDAGILQSAMDKVIAAVGGEVEADFL